jgi:hypothetical protein
MHKRTWGNIDIGMRSFSALREIFVCRLRLLDLNKFRNDKWHWEVVVEWTYRRRLGGHDCVRSRNSDVAGATVACIILEYCDGF